MKKSNHIALFVAISISLSSCFTVKVVAPADQTVTIADEYEPLEVKHKITNWYALFGSVPISKHSSTDEVIANLNLEKVRVTTKMGFGNYLLNGLLNALLPTTIVTNTTIIEGNVKK